MTKHQTDRVTRREVVQGLALLAAGSRLASAAGFRNPTVNHVSLQVSDLMRSSEFYTRTFGCVAQKRDDGTIALSLGKGFIVLRRGTPAGTLDHFSIGIDGFEQAAVIQDLKARGAEITAGQGAGVYLKDPDGVLVQVSSNGNYAGAPTAFPGSSLDHVSIHASDLQRSADFYRRVFDCVASKPDMTIHMSVGKCHISLNGGKPAGTVDHFAVGMNPFDQEAVVRELKVRGAAPVSGAGVGLHMVDPDGYTVQVIASAV